MALRPEEVCSGAVSGAVRPGSGGDADADSTGHGRSSDSTEATGTCAEALPALPTDSFAANAARAGEGTEADAQDADGELSDGLYGEDTGDDQTYQDLPLAEAGVDVFEVTPGDSEACHLTSLLPRLSTLSPIREAPETGYTLQQAGSGIISVDKEQSQAVQRMPLVDVKIPDTFNTPHDQRQPSKAADMDVLSSIQSSKEKYLQIREKFLSK